MIHVTGSPVMNRMGLFYLTLLLHDSFSEQVNDKKMLFMCKPCCTQCLLQLMIPSGVLSCSSDREV